LICDSLCGLSNILRQISSGHDKLCCSHIGISGNERSWHFPAAGLRLQFVERFYFTFLQIRHVNQHREVSRTGAKSYLGTQDPTALIDFGEDAANQPTILWPRFTGS
jgi:hypothetical protein